MLEKTRTTIRASPTTIQVLQRLKLKLKAKNVNEVIQHLILNHGHTCACDVVFSEVYTSFDEFAKTFQ